MKNALISVIVPIYNTRQYLDRCVESIISQTYQALEIILVDDGSTDGSGEMCDTWAKKDSRIKVIHKENGGAASARNKGIALAGGEYISFADSDDYLDNDIFEFLYNLLTENNADVARCGYYTNTNGAETTEFTDYSVRVLNSSQAISDLATSGYGGTPWCKLYKTQTLKAHLYNKEDGCSEDILHNFRVYSECTRLVFCDAPKYHYVIREGSITNNSFGKGAFDIIRAKSIILDYAREHSEIIDDAVFGYVFSAYIVLSGCIRSGKFEEEKNRLIKSILQYKKTIYKSPLYSKKYKLRTALLSLSPRLYGFLIERKGK